MNFSCSTSSLACFVRPGCAVRCPVNNLGPCDRASCALQVQYSLLDRRPENYMIPYCRDQNIKLLPYGTVAGGFLSERYLGVPASK